MPTFSQIPPYLVEIQLRFKSTLGAAGGRPLVECLEEILHTWPPCASFTATREGLVLTFGVPMDSLSPEYARNLRAAVQRVLDTYEARVAR